MIRVLAMISVAGLILSVVCLSIAISLAGPEFVTRGAWTWVGPFSHHHGRHWEEHWDGRWSDRGDRRDGAAASRDLAWSGGETLDVGLPAEVRFTQGAGPAKLVVRGPQEVISHVRVDHGRIDFDTPSVDADDIVVELTAPKVTRFVVSGSGRLAIHDYKQDALAVRITGDGHVTADGAAKTAAVDISGAGEADLASLALDGADVVISGAGDARLGPKSWAKLNLSGSGDVELLSRPRRLESQVSGSGRVEQGGRDEDDQAPAQKPEPTKAAGKSV